MSISFRRSRASSPNAGFTVVELLAGMTLFGFLAIFTNDLLHAPQRDLELESAAYDIAALIKQAGREAVARGVTTVVEIDRSSGEMVAYAEVNGEAAATSPVHHRYLVFDPDPALHAVRQTDYEIARLRLPEGVSFGGVTDGLEEAIEGLTGLPHRPEAAHAVVFLPRGRPLHAGAIRLRDAARRNVLEAALLDLSGNVTVRKFQLAEDSQTGTAGFVAAPPYDTSGWAWY